MFSRIRSLILSAVPLLVGMLFHPSAHAQTAGDIWQDENEVAMMAARKDPGSKRTLVPRIYRTLRVDRAALGAALTKAPREFAAGELPPAELVLPMPDGTFARFAVEESSLMEPALAAKFPEIKTYVCRGIDNPELTGRLDQTPQGFHAVIFTGAGSVYVDPYWRDDVTKYISYLRRDFVDAARVLNCQIPESVKAPGLVPRLTEAARPTGASLRTYRLAVACTGEYATAAGGGTVLGALGAIITTVNRVSAVFERDFAIRLRLVANEEQVIFTDPVTDGFTNNNTSSLVNESQTKIDAVIGNANYDIGHTFSTALGGVASLGVVGRTGLKARGTSGSPDPVGDPYDVELVAHEMGHQFAANHTFNGTNVNRNASTAYEPGSGTTIMAYTGIVAGQNLATDGDDYFHTASYDEIDAYTSGASPGNVGVPTATGNTVPTIAPLTSFTIPNQTPFFLTASATDPDAGDVLTYCWEQFDLGAAQDPTASPRDNGASPLFRSFDPSTSPVRIFPSLTYILNNANVPPATIGSFATGEFLPTTNRTMTFRVTVRDNRPGGGGSNYASTTVTSTTSSGPFALTSFDTASTIAGNSQQTITWSVANTTAAPVNCANVKISLSTDGGSTFPFVLAESTPNDGSETVTIPNVANVATTQGRFRVEAVGNIFFDLSNANTTITSTNTAPALTITGSVTVQRGTPTATVATVGTVSDVNTPLSVTISNAPADTVITASLSGNDVVVSARADASIATTNTSRTYPVTLTVADSIGSTTSGTFNLIVQPNPAPTLGTYADQVVLAGGIVNATPSAGPADANNNLGATPLTVTPATLPGGGSLSVDQATGIVTATTLGSTTVGTVPVRVTVQDTAGAATVRGFNLNVTAVPTVTLNTADRAQNAPTITIAGTNFSPTPGNNSVAFNLGAVGTVTSATPTQLTVSFSTLPSTTGALTAVVFNGLSSGAAVQVATIVAAPTVTLNTANRAQNATITIAGTGFSNTPANNIVVLSSGTATVTAATATQLTCTLGGPPALGSLTAVVTCNGGSSGGAVQVATVVPAPTVTLNTASLGVNAPTITIAGTNFPTTPADNTVAFNLGAVGTVTAATTTQLTVTFSTLPSTTGALTANLTVFGGSSGAVQVATVVAGPEIVVEQPASTELIDGVGSQGFGFVSFGGSAILTFTVRNFGNSDLTGLSVSKDGLHNADFTVGALGATTLAPGASTTFTVTFVPGALEARNAGIRIASNDSDENPFDIALNGTGLTPGVFSNRNFEGASLIIGQPDFTAQLTTASQSVTPTPSGCAISVTGKLAVCDDGGRRVLIWNSVPTSSGAPADVVLGKFDFTSTAAGVSASLTDRCSAVAFSPDGQKLLVTDRVNHRVLIWNTVPTMSAVPADVVIGQTNFTTGISGLSATKFTAPAGLLVTQSGRLLVADGQNHRVLIFNRIPTSNGAAADVVIGQGSMTTRTAGNAASQMNLPQDMAVTADGRLLVADQNNRRVLVFGSVPTTNGASASLVIGQSAFGVSDSGTSATTMRGPDGVDVSPTGTLAIADANNHRVLIFNSVPATNGAAADAVLGQPDFVSLTPFNGGVSASSMNAPTKLAFMPDGRLLVPGTGMRRVMVFGYPFPEIAVEQPLGTGVTDGTASRDFGPVPLSGNSSGTFTIRNVGGANLTGLSVSKSGTHSADFTVGALGATMLAPGATTTFTVTFAPGSPGLRTAAIHIASNDFDENPFDIALTGTGLTRLEGWRVTYFGSSANSGDGADANDFESDGMSNFLEFSLNTDPKQASPIPQSLIRNGENLEFTYIRAKAAMLDGVVFAVKWTDTLTPASWSSAGVTESILSDDGIQQVVKATLPVGTIGKRFVRLEVTDD